MEQTTAQILQKKGSDRKNWKTLEHIQGRIIFTKIWTNF